MNELDAIFNYYDRYNERVSDTNADTGSNTLSATAVPPNELWVVTAATCLNINHITGVSALIAYNGSAERLLKRKTSPPANETVDWQGWLPLKEGDYMRAFFTSCVAGDDIYLDIWGFKMRLK